MVANCGGLLLPLGDPPLFLGFLKGVDFFWTVQLWPQWLFVNGVLLAIFFAWDARARRRNRRDAGPTNPDRRDAGPTAWWAAWRDRRLAGPRHPLRIEGLQVGIPIVLGVMATLLMQAPSIARQVGDYVRRVFPQAATRCCPPGRVC